MKTLLVFLSLLAAATFVDAARSMLNIEEARCQYRKDPLGLDAPRPRFSWSMASNHRGQTQRAYQILVASKPELLEAGKADVWDSGKIASDASVNVEYAGPALASRTRYYWNARIWDDLDQDSEPSEPAFWETGLLSPGDWKAAWISMPMPPAPDTSATLHRWIWFPARPQGEQRVAFRRLVRLNSTVQSLRVDVCADDDYSLFINGRHIGGHGGTQRALRFELFMGDLIADGDNVIAALVHNATGPAGLLVGLSTSTTDGAVHPLPDEGWKCLKGEPAGWTGAGFNDQDWSVPATVCGYGAAPWGRVPTSNDLPRRAFMLRREFSLPSPPVRARLYATGLGLYDLSLNGSAVTENLLTPGWTQYHKRVPYQVYDVTNRLTRGGNALGVTLGNGWWSGWMGWSNSAPYAAEGENLRACLQLEVECEDGNRVTLTTDGRWKSHLSPIVQNSFYHGERYDARLETPGWDRAGFDDSGWTPAVEVHPAPVPLVADVAPPIKVTTQLTPQAITEPRPGVYVLDFGQNQPGFCRLSCSAPRGTAIRLRFAEILQADGQIYVENYRTARATDVYICKGEKVEVWQPRFTYRGYRYVELTGLPYRPTADTLTALVFHNALEPAGRFECSSPVLNRNLEMLVWTLRSNLHSAPTDCPQRDERLGWMGDAQVVAPALCYNLDAASFLSKWMVDVLDSQSDAGATTDVSPSLAPSGPAAPGWGDAITIVPWNVYLFYGDLRLLEQCYDGMKRWVEYMRAHSRDDLYERRGYGDWVPVEGSPSEPIGSAYYYRSTRIVAMAAKALGKAEDAREYSALAERIAAAYNQAHFDAAAHHYKPNTQTMNAMPLAFGITPEGERGKVADALAADVDAHAGHLTTGFLGSALILPVLTDYGHGRQAWQVAGAETYPSLGYMRKLGATTVWERWNTDKEGPAMNSRNHYALGAQTEWYYSALAGLAPDPQKPGFAHAIVHPHPLGDLTSARAEYRGPRGTFEVEWKIQQGQFDLRVLIPANCTATVYVPTRDASKVTEGGKPTDQAEGVKALGTQAGAAIFAVGGGRYQFSAPWLSR